MIVGYARTSVGCLGSDQATLLLQAGVERVVSDGSSLRLVRRDELLRALVPGDVLVVARLDRLGYGLVDLVDLLVDLERRCVTLRSLAEGLSTTEGALPGQVAGWCASAARSWTAEVRSSSLRASRLRGRAGGRPPKLTSTDVTEAQRRLAAGVSPKVIAVQLRVHLTTLRRALRRVSRPPARP